MSSGLKKFDIDPPALDPNGIAETQTVTDDDLALDGALCDTGTALQFDIGDAYSDGVGGVRLLFDAGSDISTAIFTITGLDQDGNSITEAVTGVTTTAVSTVQYYSQVTVIAVTVAEATGVFVGTVTGELVSKTVPVNHHSRIAAVGSVTGLVGTCQFDLEQCFDDLNTVLGSAATWFAFESDASADVATASSRGCTGIRCHFDSYSTGAELQFHVSYNP